MADAFPQADPSKGIFQGALLRQKRTDPAPPGAARIVEHSGGKSDKPPLGRMLNLF
jgi:hypothetical protein